MYDIEYPSPQSSTWTFSYPNIFLAQPQLIIPVFILSPRHLSIIVLTIFSTATLCIDDFITILWFYTLYVQDSRCMSLVPTSLLPLDSGTNGRLVPNSTSDTEHYYCLFLPKASLTAEPEASFGTQILPLANHLCDLNKKLNLPGISSSIK